VCVVGAACVDLAGHSLAPVRKSESNPGSLRVSWGGVGRNIAENLARLEIPVHLITVMADDEYGVQMAEHARACGLHLNTRTINGASSPCYLCVIDPNGELVVAVSDTALLDHLDIGLVQQNWNIIQNAALCVIDTNLDEKVIGHLLEHFPDTDFCVDLVSMAKAEKLGPWLDRVSLIKPNRAEAGQLSGMDTSDQQGLMGAADYFLAKGVSQVFISLGDDGLFYTDGHGQGTLLAEAASFPLAVTGAGDAMMAGLVYARFHGMALEQSAQIAMAASMIALQHPDAVNPQISPSSLNQALEYTRHA
jgi:pseudouridine kinase